LGDIGGVCLLVWETGKGYGVYMSRYFCLEFGVSFSVFGIKKSNELRIKELRIKELRIKELRIKALGFKELRFNAQNEKSKDRNFLTSA